MQMILSFFLSHPALIVFYGVLALVSWYGILVLNYGINGGQLGRGRWWVFECFLEDILLNVPGGSKRKADRIREMVGETGDGFFCSSSGSWSHEKLRETDEYEICGQAMFGSALQNWITHIVIFLVAVCVGPIFVCGVVCAGIISLPFHKYQHKAK